MPEPIARIAFSGPLVEWRGPAPYCFVRIPEAHVGEVRYAARIASYGWGCVPVAATIDGHAFTTSLFPFDGGYMLPVKAAVRRTSGLSLGDAADVEITVSTKG